MERVLVLSRFATTVPIDDMIVVGSGLVLRRLILPAAAEPVLTALRTGTTQTAVLGALAAAGLPVSWLDSLLEAGLVLPEGHDEVVEFSRKMQAAIDSPPEELWSGRRFDIPLPSFPLPRDGTPKPLSVSLLGGCWLQAMVPYLEHAGLQRGFAVEAWAGWPDDLHLVSHFHPDVVVLQPFTLWDLSKLLDQTDPSSAARRHALEEFKMRLRTTIERVAAEAGDAAFLLVLGLVGPSYPPGGRQDFLAQTNSRTITHEVNELLSDCLRTRNALLIDVERLFARHGTLNVLDDAIAPYSHHGLLDYVTAFPETGARRRRQVGGDAHLGLRLLSAEVIDGVCMRRGAGMVKCVITDLDNTLWPGVAGTEGFNLYEAFQAFRYGSFGGLHQALHVLKGRGVLLASCSVNDEATVMAAWEAAAFEEPTRTLGPDDDHVRHIRFLLRPDDFVLHSIEWRPKPERIAEIAKRLGIGLDAVVFIDDCPVERQRVADMLPQVRVLGENMEAVRAILLSDPAYEPWRPTQEALSRTHLIRRQLARETERRNYADEREFLSTLSITITLSELGKGPCPPRLTELAMRTNQFNTSGSLWKPIPVEPPVRIFTVRVRDRFVNYGLVGLCCVESRRITCVAFSCRVIGLRVALPAVAAIIRDRLPERPLHAVLAKNVRNFPCHNLFTELGAIGGEELFIPPGHIPQVDESIYRVVWD